MCFDQNGILHKTTLHPDTNVVEADSVYLNKMGESIDPNIAFLSYRDAGANLQPQPKAKAFGVYDIPSRSVMQQVPLDTIGSHHIVISFDQDSSHLILGGGLTQNGLGYRAFYSIYDNNYNLLKTRVQTSSNLFGVQAAGGKYYIFYHSPQIQFEVLNSDLSLDTLVMRPPFYPHPSHDHFRTDFRVIPNAHGPGFYTLAFFQNSNYAVVKFNEDYSVVRIDSFPIHDYKGTYGHAAPWKKAFDYNTPDSIYAIAGFWSLSESKWAGMDSVGRTEPIRVVLFDTTGTVHWSRLIVRDSAVYFPYQLKATKDGGVLVFSMLYDVRYSTKIHSQLSVIKLGPDGSILHENEYDIPQRGELEIYPNPVSNKLHIKLDELHGTAAGQYNIFSIDAGGRLSGSYHPDEPIDVEKLAPGTYFIHLQLENGAVSTGRFVKSQ